MSNKNDREQKEMANLFKDPKFMRKAWQAVGKAILQSPAMEPVVRYDKEGNVTSDYEIERYTYSHLAADVQSLGEGDKRQPTELEMILGCQIRKARTDTGAAIFVRDTVGAKPIDESKVDQHVFNQYSELTDEELDLLVKFRENKTKSEDN